jgi:hypothetical protein
MRKSEKRSKRGEGRKWRGKRNEKGEGLRVSCADKEQRDERVAKTKHHKHMSNEEEDRGGDDQGRAMPNEINQESHKRSEESSKKKKHPLESADDVLYSLCVFLCSTAVVCHTDDLIGDADKRQDGRVDTTATDKNKPEVEILLWWPEWFLS